MYKYLIRPLLFQFAPEKVHHVTMDILKMVLKIPFIGFLLRKLFVIKSPKLKKELWGLNFENPVGLAAGFDKNAEYYHELSHLGFGFIEVGTVTPLAQEGNEKPRLFRLREDEAILNRMGFNNIGLEKMIENLKKKNTQLIIGGNIGKNKITPNEEALNDYIQCFKGLHPYVDYFVVNVSSPNTPNLRALQEKGPLKQLLSSLKTEDAKKEKHKPILLKIAPDLSTHQLDEIVEIVKEIKLDGIVATNTTINREGLLTKEISRMGSGGISGKPLNEKSNEIIRYLRNKLGKEVPIIGVGGIMSAGDALKKIEAGADLVQIYTGFIYEGPSLVKKINKQILNTKGK